MFSREMLIVAERMKTLTELLPLLNTIEKELDQNVRDFDKITDVTFLTRKSKEIMASIEKRLNQLERKAAENACAVFPLIEEKKYSNDNATISDNSKPYVKFPNNPNDEEFEEFVKQLPVCALRPHYPTVSELIVTELEKAGQLPFGLPPFGLISVESKLRMTPKRDL